MPESVKVGVIGTGAISGAYLGMAKNFPIVEIAACADIDIERAKQAGEKFQIAKVCTVDELLADPGIEIVLNLTIPKAHVPISLRAIEAGKHTYLEKPLGVDKEEGKVLLAAAKKAKKRIGCAPDTFLGAGLQTARKLIDDGAIGRPVAFTAFMMGRGHEGWHPNPEFYYQVGGGPMFDMGPYYLTALLNLLGRARKINGMASIAIPDRTITSQPLSGKKISVETPDHIVGSIEFENGAVGTIIQTFACYHAPYDHKHPIVIYGETGTLQVPDPNGFDGTVLLQSAGEKQAREMPHSFVVGYGRSVGLADMAYAVRSGRKHRVSGELGFAVLEMMQGFLDSSRTGKAIYLKAKYERPAPMRAELAYGTLDE
ncbi:MAG TPA: Gfo/Idh/MocA family oxidoreductase [Tepidisphaeraceae bacterium]|jgi:predicted dehydrogenase|nr:Gfo/Idh/MocA family oxidoreductase [Tepidisphaeraceae bacterium]